MSIAELVTKRLRTLPLAQQQQVLDFAEFLAQKHQPEKATVAQTDSADLPLGERLRAIRQRAIAAGMTLEPADQIAEELSVERERPST